MRGVTSWKEFVFANGSGPLGRPLSMASFLANAAISGLTPFPFKATNLGIHLLNGALIYVLLSKLLKRDPRLAASSKTAALAVTSIWLLHPMQVSTVLYIVQRMTELSAFFTLLALLSYVSGRNHLLSQRPRAGMLHLFVVLPICTVAATLSKETGALVPLYCAVIEWIYFRQTSGTQWRWPIRAFFALFLVLPGSGVLGGLAIRPGYLTGGYAGRPFTLLERIYSEPRALMDYMGALLLPRGPSLGLYTDDFAVSHGLLNPPATLISILALLGLIVAGIILRKRVPAISAGIGLYLAGHALESTIFPLELYFEHRNYLPSFGFFLAIAGAIGWLFEWIKARRPDNARLPRLLQIGAVTLVAALSISTAARAGVWSSLATLAAQGAAQHPDSVRAQLDHANMLQLEGRPAEAQRAFDHLATLDNPTANHVAAIDTVTLQCMTEGRTTATATGRIRAITGAKLSLAELLAVENLAKFVRNKGCVGLTKVELATMIVDIVDATGQPPRLVQLWRNRFIASQLYLAAGLLNKAIEQAGFAWMTGAADPSVGVYLANLYYLAGDKASARLVLQDARKRIESWDERNQLAVKQLEDHFEQRTSEQDAKGLR